MKRVAFNTREEVEESVSKKDTNDNNNNKNKNKKVVRIEEAPVVPTLNSNDVINIKLVWDLSKDMASEGFHPEFTHQIFEEEEIKGYDNLKIDLLYDVSSMLSFLSVDNPSGSSSGSLKKVKRNCTNITQCFATFFPQPPLDNFDFFTRHANEKVTPPVIQSENFIERYKNGESEFEVFKIKLGQSNQKIEEYHQRAQSIAIFYIEAASFIETDDPNWTVYYLYEKRGIGKGVQYGLVGFCTLYSFYHHPSSTRQRISQFIVFPPYQKRGHGVSFLNVIYNDLKKGNLFDITVEDPSIDFQRLRDRVDMQNLLHGDFFKGVTSLNDTSKYPEIRQKLFLFKDQIRRCHEIYEMMALKNKKDTLNYETEYKEYRLKVKRRLLKKYMDSLTSIAKTLSSENEHGDEGEEREEREEEEREGEGEGESEGSAQPTEVDPEVRKKQLHELFEELESEYLAVIAKL